MSLPFLQLSLLKWSFKCHAQGKGAFGFSLPYHFDIKF